MPASQASGLALAVSDERGAHETLAAFRLTPEPSFLVTVAMAYVSLDAPEGTVVAERRLRQRLAERVAAQAVEDAQGGGEGVSVAPVPVAPRGAGLFHAYNAVLKRALGVSVAAAAHCGAWERCDASAGWARRCRRGSQTLRTLIRLIV